MARNILILFAVLLGLSGCCRPGLWYSSPMSGCDAEAASVYPFA
ncbi:hypothetical protein [Neoroseomonas eburnea]|nr:hypothetical protein [Neoroseomonas eburnea]